MPSQNNTADRHDRPLNLFQGMVLHSISVISVTLTTHIWGMGLVPALLLGCFAGIFLTLSAATLLVMIEDLTTRDAASDLPKSWVITAWHRDAAIDAWDRDLAEERACAGLELSAG